MSDASLIALFSLGMASTLTVLFLAFRRTFRLEQERTLMRRMRRRLDRMLLSVAAVITLLCGVHDE